MRSQSIKLWAQGTEKSGSCMSVNGKMVDGSDPMYDKYYDAVCETEGMKLTYKDKWSKVFYSKEANAFSFLFKAHYTELDEAGRRIVFMSKIEGAETIQDAVTMLARESKACGYTLNEQEMYAVANAFAKRGNSKLMVTLIVVAMCCIAYALYRALNN